MTPPSDLPQVLLWRDGAWHPIEWACWMSFRGIGESFVPLPEVGAGEHHFVVCAVEDGRLFNIIPHRYLVDADGRIVDDGYFDVLSTDEVELYEALNKRYYAWPETHPLNEQEQRDFEAIRERLWRSWLPPITAMRELTRAVT